MKSNYYDPNFYKTNVNNPNIMEIIIKLEENIDKNILQSVVNNLRYRYPYFYVYLDNDDKEYILKTNPYPISIRNTWNPSFLGSDETNYHLIAIKYNKNSMAIEFSKSLTDDLGIIPFIKSILYYYIKEKYNRNLDSDGIRLVNTKKSEKESGNPFQINEVLNNKEIMKKDNTDFYIPKKTNDNFNKLLHSYFIKIDEKDITSLIKNNIDIELIFSSILVQSIKDVEDVDKKITAAIAINHKDILNNIDNYKDASDIAIVNYSIDLNNIMDSYYSSKEQLLNQITKENSINHAKDIQKEYEDVKKISSLMNKINYYKEKTNDQNATIKVSYLNDNYNSLNKYIKEVFKIDDDKSYPLTCNISCLNNNYYITLVQTFKSDIYLKRFLKLLEENNISYELLGSEDTRISGINYENIKTFTRRLEKN